MASSRVEASAGVVGWDMEIRREDIIGGRRGDHKGVLWGYGQALTWYLEHQYPSVEQGPSAGLVGQD